MYIWMEGTDADCVNGKSVEDDSSTYDVTKKLAGVAKRKLNVLFERSWHEPWLFFYPNIPILATIPTHPTLFSVHLLNCYFPDFSACHIAEKFMKCSCFLNPANTTDERVNFHSTM